MVAAEPRCDHKGKEYTVYMVRCAPKDEAASKAWTLEKRFSGAFHRNARRSAFCHRAQRNGRY